MEVKVIFIGNQIIRKAYFRKYLIGKSVVRRLDNDSAVLKAGKTLSYYNENAKEFAERTVDVDFSENYSMFLGKLKKDV